MNTRPKKKTKPLATPNEEFQSKVVLTRMFAKYLQDMYAAGAIDSACGRNWHGWIGTDGATWWLDATHLGQRWERITAASLAELKAAAVAKFGE